MVQGGGLLSRQSKVRILPSPPNFMFRDEKSIVKFPHPIVVHGFAEEERQRLQAEYYEARRREVLKQDTKSLIQRLRNLRYGQYDSEYAPCYTEQDLVAELATRPHQRNKKERKEFVAKQQKRTERKTKGAR